MIYDWLTCLHDKLCYQKASKMHLVDHFSAKHVVSSVNQLNPSKLEKNEDVNVNLAHLLSIVSELVEKIFMAAEILPPWVYLNLLLRSTRISCERMEEVSTCWCFFCRTLRFIYGCLQKAVQQKWPRNTTMRTRVVRYGQMFCWRTIIYHVS